MAIERNESWVNFINLYKNLPELWNVKNDNYKNKSIRAAAYKKLTKEYKNIDENATTEKVKHRIKNMRFTYKRELKKKMASAKSGAGVEDLYEPNLWYFNNFNFLNEFEQPEDGISTMMSCSDDESTSPMPKKAKRQRNSARYERNQLLRKATMHIENLKEKKERDEADIYGEAWAYSYRKLPNSQKLFAKKACDEIFILGHLGKLSLNSVRAKNLSYSFQFSNSSSE